MHLYILNRKTVRNRKLWSQLSQSVGGIDAKLIFIVVDSGPTMDQDSEKKLK